MNHQVRVLLASASAGGTLAAVRNLGIHGIDVGVICSQPLSAAAWSRWVSRSHRVPLETNSREFLEQLLAIGKADPGQILLPTSDETAWLYTINAGVLGKYFQLYQPPLETIECVLDKKLLEAAALKAGICTLPSWYPRGSDDIQALAPSLPYPILIKPRTHVHRLRNDKGMVANSPTDLVQRYFEFIDHEHTDASDRVPLSDSRLPMLQQFVRKEGVRSVSGFIDRAGEHFVTRHSTKVFQRSWPVGVGVSFESLPAISEISDSVRRLCREVGYFGIFEVEFLPFNGSWAIIDFNPRLFNQAWMDIRRNMPLPLLACLDTVGVAGALRVAVKDAQSEDKSTKMIFYDRFTLGAILCALTITGRISHRERSKWRSWKTQSDADVIDLAWDAADPMPGVVHAMSEIYLGLRAFPRFLRSARVG